MAAEKQFIGVDAINNTARILHRDLIMTPTILNAAIFEALGVNVIEGIQDEDIKYVMHLKGNSARQYDIKAKDIEESELGYTEERKLKVKLAYVQFPDNIQRYRSTIIGPSDLLGSNQTYVHPMAESVLRQSMRVYSGDVIKNFIHGDESLKDDKVLHSYGLYNGVLKLINMEIESGNISVLNENLVTGIVIDTSSTGKDDTDAFVAFCTFVDSFAPPLKEAPEVLVYCTPQVRKSIIYGFAHDLENLQDKDMASSDYRFPGYENIKLVGTALMGHGDKMIATIPGNIDFGCDGISDMEYIKMLQIDKDPNKLRLHIQSNQAVRINNVSAEAFCITDGTLKPVKNLNANYFKNTFYAGTSDSALGTVTVSPVKEEYDRDDIITVTAEPTSEGEFVSYSDGSTTLVKSVVYSGHPSGVTAIFKKKTT